MVKDKKRKKIHKVAPTKNKKPQAPYDRIKFIFCILIGLDKAFRALQWTQIVKYGKSEETGEK